MSSNEDAPVPPLAGKVIPVLRDIIEPALDPLPQVPELSPEQRRALAAETRVILEELIGDCLPALEAALRERLTQRITAMLGG